jgi:hypothetical protein
MPDRWDYDTEDVAALQALLDCPVADVKVNCLRIRRSGDVLRLTHAPPAWRVFGETAIGIPLCGLLVVIGIAGAVQATKLYFQTLATLERPWQYVLLHWAYVVALVVLSVGFVISAFVVLDLMPRHLEIDLGSSRGRFRQLFRRGVKFDLQRLALLEIVVGDDHAHLAVALNGRNRRLPIWWPIFNQRSSAKSLAVLEPVAHLLSRMLERPVDVVRQAGWSRMWI